MPLVAGTNPSTTMSGPLGFFGATPTGQPNGYSSQWTTAARQAGSYTPTPKSSNYAGGLLDLLQAARLSDLNDLRAAVENNRTFMEDTRKQLNALVEDLKTLGLIG